MESCFVVCNVTILQQLFNSLSKCTHTTITLHEDPVRNPVKVMAFLKNSLVRQPEEQQKQQGNASKRYSNLKK